MKNFLFLGMFFWFCVTANACTKHDDSSSVTDDPCSCSIGANSVTSTTRKITLAQAKALVMAALTPEQRQLRGIAIDSPDKKPDDISTYEDRYRPRFLMFNVIWNSPMDSSINVGFFGVDIYTGDVFDGVGGCPEYKNRGLNMLQKEIRRYLHLTKIEYKKLKTAGPMCDPDN